MGIFHACLTFYYTTTSMAIQIVRIIHEFGIAKASITNHLTLKDKIKLDVDSMKRRMVPMVWCRRDRR